LSLNTRPCGVRYYYLFTILTAAAADSCGDVDDDINESTIMMTTPVMMTG